MEEVVLEKGYGNLKIPARLRSDLEIGRSRFVRWDLQRKSAGRNLQISAHRVAIFRLPFYCLRVLEIGYGNLKIPARLRSDLEIRRSRYSRPVAL